VHVDVGANGQWPTASRRKSCAAPTTSTPVTSSRCILPGGVLPGNFEISARKTYGHVSAGMICSERELGLGDDHDGIIVLTRYFAGDRTSWSRWLPGMDAIALLGLDRETVEVNVTPTAATASRCAASPGSTRTRPARTSRDPADIALPRRPRRPTAGGYAVRLVDERPHPGPGGL
jgi:phenylalanyl-tRNA synthetase beta chain